VNRHSPPINDYRDLNDVFADGEDGSALTFTVQSNSNPGVVTAVIDPTDSTLDLSLVPGQRGVATIVIRATDSGSAFAEDTFVLAAAAADMQMATGSYLGNGIVGSPITNVGFQPDVLFIKADNNEPTVVRTSTMVGDAAKELGQNSALLSNVIISLDADGFTIGSNQQVNSAGVDYYWVAFKAATGEMALSTYPGDGNDDRSIPGVGFQPDYLIVMSEIGQQAMQRFSSQAGDNSLPFNPSDPKTDRIQAFEPDGFQIGKHNTVNENGVTFHYIAWKLVPGRIAGSLYLGDGGDNRDMAGVGFQPDYQLISRQKNGSPTVQRPASLAGDNTLPVDDNAPFNNGIQTFLPNGFQIGSDDTVNRLNDLYFWVAFRGINALDLALTKSVSDTIPNEGDTLTYNVVLTNNGPDDATGVEVTDLLPAGVTYLSDATSQGTYASGTGLWTLGAVANSVSDTLAISIAVDAGTAGSTIGNTASITAVDQSDSVSTNDTDTAIITVPSVDLELAKIVDIAAPLEGDTIDYTITLTNNSPDEATQVRVSDQLPAGVTYISYSATQGNYAVGSGLWNLNSLPGGDSDTLTIAVSVDGGTAGSTITNVAVFTSAEQPDLNPANDADSVAITIPAVDLAIAKIVDNSTPTEGDTVVYTITLTNNSPDNATGVEVTDLLPAGVSFVSDSPTQGTYNSGTGVWTVGTVVNAVSDTLAITSTVQ
jgi:uncharacterized repeat protein (TIGR01451 family)